jgi:hypothetical protein
MHDDREYDGERERSEEWLKYEERQDKSAKQYGKEKIWL